MTAILDRVIALSVRHRLVVVALVLAFVAGAIAALDRMTFDAFPDLTNVQVQVLTASPGMGSEEVELLVTLPVERVLGGLAGVAELRSVSRPGVSSVTVVFEDGTDPWLARQMVKEQVDVARGEIPETAGTPELGPPSTGLGEVYQLTMASDTRSASSLYRVFERDVAPRLRAIDGVVEVNAWGGGAPQLEVQLDPWRLAAHGLTFGEVEAAVSSHLAITSGGEVEAASDRFTVRAVSNPTDPEALGALVLRQTPTGPVRLADVADVSEGGALTVGLGSADAEGDVVFVMVQLLAGADARQVTADVRARLGDIQATVPEDVRLDPIYDRDQLVGSALSTVARSLSEGALLVILVLLVVLGDLRAGLLVASVIPLSLLGAFTGLSLLGWSGNLMSLGAIDFGLVVDGTIVVVESIVAMEVGRRGDLGPRVAARTRAVGRPVLFAVGILLLVYAPVLFMQGTEGKLFRPMAVTVVLALLTALVLSFTWVPAVATWVVRPHGEHQTRLMAAISAAYRPVLRRVMAHPRRALGVALALVLAGGLLASRLGVEFTPRLEEGDLVVQTARLPGLSVAEARRGAARVEAVLGSFPEVLRVASRTGSPAVATDPMGMEEADILVRLAPRDTWVTADTTEGLVDAIAARLEAEAPGPEYTFTQPIEMRFNELLEGITSDVGVAVHGQDLDALLRAGQQISVALEGVPGAADVRAPSVDGMPGVDIELDPVALAGMGVRGADVHGLVAGVRRGVPVGGVLRGQFQDPVVLRTRLPRDVSLVDLPVVREAGGTVTLGDVGRVRQVARPAVVRRQGGARRVMVQANVRGRDLGGFVQEAQDAVAGVALPDGVWIEWSGKYEQLRAAALRTAIAVPTILVLILGVLYGAFGSWRPALLIFLNVPAAATGGVLSLWARGLPISMSAVVGFVALFGVAVMNGVVLLSRTQELHEGPDTTAAAGAAFAGAMERLRPVLMTAMVAGIGFLPMAVASGIGAEVQRPLATVVIGGLMTATPLTLLVLPSLYAGWVRRPARMLTEVGGALDKAG